MLNCLYIHAMTSNSRIIDATGVHCSFVLFWMKPGLLPSMGLQRVGYNWATELNWLRKCPDQCKKRRPPGGGHGSPLQYYCLGNPMDGGVWRAPVHGVPKRHKWRDLACLQNFLWEIWSQIFSSSAFLLFTLPCIFYDKTKSVV